MSTTPDHRNLVRSLPGAPGVYRMLDAQGRLLYVGKARDLRKRVASYFRASGLPPKTQAMMRHVQDVDVTVTHTEGEALLLENNLIKQHRPRYNVVLRDDKSYPYIRLADEHEFPRLSFYRGSRREPGRYFGPYPSAHSVRATLAQMQKVFPVRQCEDTFFRNRSRPCLQYQIGRCTAPCVGYVERERYLEDVRQAVMFLEGRSSRLLEELMASMEQASARLDFEAAARYRDRIAAVQRIQERQYVTGEGGDADVVAACEEGTQAAVSVLFIRGGQNIGTKTLYPSVALDMEAADVLAAFLPQYYLGKPVPQEIVVSHAIEGRELLEQTLSAQVGHSVALRANPRGHRAKWLEMARVNAQDALRRHLAGRASMAQRLEALRAALGLEQSPERIECFDISHSAGEAPVASCVVFDAEGPVKSDYRRFNIGGITPGDDYGAMTQALTRRYRRLKEGEGKIPDVLLIDGGRGQVNAAQAVLGELQVDGVRIVGIAKGPTRKAGLEKLFVPGRSRHLTLRPESPALHLVQSIRDEAHRFAITGHRQRRGRARTSSSLQEIPGVGAKRRQALLRHLGGLQGVTRAGVEDLARVPGISPRLARRIYDSFHADG